MTDDPCRTVLERLRAVGWEDDSAAFAHAPSRALLMREYLRRSALWARACGAEGAWPFFDVAEHLGAGAAQPPPDVAAELEDLLHGLAPASLRTTCRAAVRWAAVRDAEQGMPADLPDPYEPLLLMYERGGGYYLEEYVDLNGTMIRLGSVEENAAAAPFLTLAPATLDAMDAMDAMQAMDAEGGTAHDAKADGGCSREHPGGILLERLRAVEWDGDWEDAFARVMSRRLLMREYLRRAGLWARACSAESAWPFFDVVEHVDPEFTLSSEIAEALHEHVDGTAGSGAVTRTCTGAVRLAEYRSQHPDAFAGLPDLYEPLVLFYERGGEFLQDGAGFLDLAGVLMRPGTLRGCLGTPALRSLDRAVLDAVDAEGRITYYAPADREGPLLRRRVVRGGAHAEVFGRDGLRWEPAGRPLPASPDRAGDLGLVRLDEMEAADLIAAAVAEAAR
ncbi:hypothetical protein ACFV7Q_32440 [Streptomyces sp. NPDC059851]|uniref:hypothetical protein n=1 Tax=Streptomyces sp. NPDC059851 TaxID=3346971 RepID=UPI003666F9E3